VKKGHELKTYPCSICGAKIPAHGKSLDWKLDPEKICQNCKRNGTNIIHDLHAFITLYKRLAEQTTKHAEESKQQLYVLDKKVSDVADQVSLIAKVVDEFVAKAPTLQTPISIETQPILTLPKHLQTTCLALVALGEATAHDVADKTHRARPVESAYLNQLVTLGFATGRRRQRLTKTGNAHRNCKFFRLNPQKLQCAMVE
jgi:hypothetical protein